MNNLVIKSLVRKTNRDGIRVYNINVLNLVIKFYNIVLIY